MGLARRLPVVFAGEQKSREPSWFAAPGPRLRDPRCHSLLVSAGKLGARPPNDGAAHACTSTNCGWCDSSGREEWGTASRPSTPERASQPKRNRVDSSRLPSPRATPRAKQRAARPAVRRATQRAARACRSARHAACGPHARHVACRTRLPSPRARQRAVAACPSAHGARLLSARQAACRRRVPGSVPSRWPLPACRRRAPNAQRSSGSLRRPSANGSLARRSSRSLRVPPPDIRNAA